MQLRTINIFPLKFNANEEEFEKILFSEYVPLWLKIPGCLKIEVLKKHNILSPESLKSVKIYATTELWDSPESMDNAIRSAEDQPYSDTVKPYLDVMEKWQKYIDPEKPLIYLHSLVINES